MVDDLFATISVEHKINQQVIDNAIKVNANYHRIYTCLAINARWRNQVNNRWLEVRHLCERNFSTEFQEKDKFYSRLWELNLRYLFKNSIIRAPASSEPDLIGNQYLIEAVVPQPVNVPRVVYDGQLRDYPTDEIALRVTTAIKSKIEQFDKRLVSAQQRIDYPNTPYVIAVGLPTDDFRDATAMAGVSIVEAVLMGVGPMQITIPNDGSKAKVGNSAKFTMQNARGIEFDVAYFIRAENSKISAALWSSELIPELEDIHVLLNPLATKSLNPTEIGDIANVYAYSAIATGWQRDQEIKR